MMNFVAELPDTTTHRKTREMRTNLEREKTEGNIVSSVQWIDTGREREIFHIISFPFSLDFQKAYYYFILLCMLQ